jgi:hypothetical protein
MEKTDILISNPCNKDWNKMTPRNNGKHCNACNKTVIDFTTWEVEDIKTYLKSKNENVCGHFKALQVAVQRPKHHQFLVDLYLKTDHNFKTPYFKTIILSLIVFCMTVVGCNRPTIHDEICMNNYQDTTRNKIKGKEISTQPELIQFLGRVKRPEPIITDTCKTKK